MLGIIGWRARYSARAAARMARRNRTFRRTHWRSVSVRCPLYRSSALAICWSNNVF